MSRATVRTPTQGRLENQISRLMELGPNLATTTLEATRSFVEQASGLISDALPEAPIPLAQRPASSGPGLCGCEIPETECPPRCPCEIVWKAGRGERLVCRIRVRNTSTESREMHFHATPFEGGSESPDAQLDLSHSKASLEPGQSLTLTGEITVSDDFEIGERYVSEVIIRSDHEQCVKVVVCVEDSTARCEVDHGKRPIRIRAHRWYDHFQCVEPCPPHHHPRPEPEPEPQPEP